MKYFRLIILTLILWNLPSFALVNFNASIGSILSYSSFFLITVYYFLNIKEKSITPLILLGLFYFFISALVDPENTGSIIVSIIKYFIFVGMGAKIVKDSTKNEIFIIMLLGVLSVIYESIFTNSIYGRFSGFYLNPNLAGCVSILGYTLSFSINSKITRIVGQISFSLAGFLTFSRTFLLIWVLINIVSLLITYKNLYKIFLGVAIFTLFLNFGERFDFNTKRLSAFAAMLDGKISDTFEEDSRTDTWSKYYERIYSNPFFGNGYLSFSGKKYGEGENANVIQGVHNTFLMIMGEAGIFVLIYFCWIYFGLIINSAKVFKRSPAYFLMILSLILYMLTSHNYFDNYIILFFSMWSYLEIYNKNKLALKV